MDLWIRAHNYINTYEDVLSGKWFLMTSPVPVLVTSGLYLYAVIILPGGLDALHCYPDKTEHCDNGETSEQTKGYSYYFHLSKYTDLIDTIIFLLRKKYSQVSVLHVYHHSTMPFWTWMCVKYNPCGRLTFHALLNSFVHIVMYTYYLLSAFGPRIRKYVWWKKYVTMCQMVQLVLTSLHAAQSAIYGCNVFLILSVLNSVQSTIYLILFWFFYKQAYKKDDIQKEIIGDYQEVNYKKYKTN
ncbi:unnamed protein product [Psylliodes chrysocephalus]|uniref:Elongation of very long chain fatty acids protein n=1 Tax=Psylliodes chrysocephalus TaxID=3402493 RepID=A0A9P0CZ11_9CUCU|nr:unnamed protein product [Psylliodes chrysocephala]